MTQTPSLNFHIGINVWSNFLHCNPNPTLLCYCVTLIVIFPTQCLIFPAFEWFIDKTYFSSRGRLNWRRCVGNSALLKKLVYSVILSSSHHVVALGHLCFLFQQALTASTNPLLLPQPLHCTIIFQPLSRPPWRMCAPRPVSSLCRNAVHFR